MNIIRRWSAVQLIFGGCALWSLLLISCETANRTVVIPGTGVPGRHLRRQQGVRRNATPTRPSHFATATHAKLRLADAKWATWAARPATVPAACTCNRAARPAPSSIPGKSPEACFQCHLDKRGEFSLPHTHPVWRER
jgi:hypothetical protein